MPHRWARRRRAPASRALASQRELVRGVATCWVEFFEAAQRQGTVPDVVFVPIGLGSGFAAAAAARAHCGVSSRLIGVVSAHATAYLDSFKAGRWMESPVTHAAGRRHGLPHPGARSARSAAARGGRRDRGQRRRGGRGDARAVHRHAQRGRRCRRRGAGRRACSSASAGAARRSASTVSGGNVDARAVRPGAGRNAERRPSGRDDDRKAGAPAVRSRARKAR